MRREQPGTHGAHRDEEHQDSPAHAVEQPRKRSYERVIDGEEPFPDDLTDGLNAAQLPVDKVEPTTESPTESTQA